VAFPALLRNQATSELLRSLSTMENQQVELLSRRSVDDPDVQILAAREHEIEAQLRSVTETYLEGLTAHVAALDHAITERGTELARIPAQQVEFDRRARTPDVLEELVVLLQTRLKEAQIAEAVEDPTIQVVDAAMLPESPAEPVLHLNLAFGLLVGLLLGGAVTLTRENLSYLVRTRGSLQALSGAAVVGLIPRFPRRNPRIARLFGPVASRKRSSSPHALLTVGVPRAVAAAKAFDAYSRLWANLSFVADRRGIRTFLVTSPLSGDGKTVTTMNLALAMAHHGGRVLLVDGDLRRGVIHERFALRSSPGLSEVLLGSHAAADVVHRVPLEGCGELHCLTRGSDPEGPSALLGSARVESLLAELQDEYDFVVIDSPPINVVSDAVILARHAGGVVLVARAGSTVADAISYSIEQLSLIEAPVLAAVLNDVDLRRDSSYDSASAYLRRADHEYFAPTATHPQAAR
jgi:tyrosine-protein kinase Etk/Wzc